MGLISFCGLLTLQVGAAILAAVFFTLAAVILVANIFDYHSNIVDGWFPFSLVLMLIFVIGLVIAGILMFASSYNESRSLALAAVVVIIILLCYWVILCAFSFLSDRDHVDGVCIDRRCPESFWIANLRYRGYQYYDYVDENGNKNETTRRKRDINFENDDSSKLILEKTYNKHADAIDEWEENEVDYLIEEEISTEELKDLTWNLDAENNGRFVRADTTPSSTTRHHKRKKRKRKENKDDEDYYEDDDWRTKKYVFGVPMIGAIILFFVNLLFLLYSAYLMYSWAQELDWTDYYYDDDPVVVVEDY